MVKIEYSIAQDGGSYHIVVEEITAKKAVKEFKEAKKAIKS